MYFLTLFLTLLNLALLSEGETSPVWDTWVCKKLLELDQ